MSYIFTKRFAITAIIVIILLLLFLFILPISIPLIAAFITALFLEPLVKSLFAKSKLTRNTSVIVIFLLFILFIGISSYFLITKVVGEGIQFAQNVPFYVSDINRAWYDLENRLQNVAKDMPKEVVIEITQQVGDFLEGLRNSITDSVNINNVKQIVTEIPNYLVSLIVYLIALFLFMMDLPRLKNSAFSHMTEKTAEKVQFMTSRLSYVVLGFLKAQFLVSILIFFTCLIGLLMIVEPELAIVMSFIIWIIDFIPLIGSIIILGPWALFLLLTGQTIIGTKIAILAAILLIIRRTVEPKVMGTQIGLSPLSTLIAMYLGLEIFGILGFIIGPLLLIAFNTAREAGVIKINFKI
ncbi:sporulation integral membrane protein YtvI [Bacillus mesophilus]|uniref:Sporulation integral membrane protein YtvI n=1 Tax=Bacillus mesophilus TaxID=1808955 RepID=A0A6M0Q3N7_9BACI|nr:sporulation integral membrane protein YtvI [Bacillus mesophilus]MBM7659496.1 sporulation integral membrane protein YtvI [Bacillus mesophilus]NEY70369.1 sporulation integral membrane protein YtvI [Bacillus mesophilus]